ncbi:URC4/urg3 family protein [Myxococcaceae bacterium GXIMD 01537]
MPDSTAVQYLRSPKAIRERCGRLLELGLAGQLKHFRVDLDRMPAVVDLVEKVTREAYPDGNVPVHSRWGHFDVGGVARNAELDARLEGMVPAERARVKLDLVITSVLLDAGSGPTWKYREEVTGAVYARSEGLAVASFRMFLAGAFSSDSKRPLQADAAGLQGLTREALARGFQVTEDNPLAGMDGRLHLLRELGRALPRPGSLFDALVLHHGKAVRAEDVLAQVLESLGGIWPGRVVLGGVNLGDVWPHSGLGPAETAEGLVPFHKLSQWLTYSLVEPLAEGGLAVSGLNALTGLPEYRNGGLLVDAGVLVPRDPALLTDTFKPGAEPIVEWRALTVALLDRVAEEMRRRLGRTAEELPLASVLQGGTWSAGRRIAADKRPGGGPPIRIESDGTVF